MWQFYVDGTNQIEEPNNRCFLPIWKRPEDSNNKIAKSARNQLKWKSHTNRGYCRKYFNYLNLINQKNYKFDFSWKPEFSDYRTDDESNSYSSYDDANSDSDNDTFQIVNSIQPVIFKQKLQTTKNKLQTTNNKLIPEFIKL